MIADEAAMLTLGARLADLVRPGDVIALSGGLGAGKTTLARGLLAMLGLEEEAPSPSFAIVQPYDPPLVRMGVAHVDLYRLEDEADLDELGLDEYLDEGIIIIEWPERMGDRLWAHALHLTIEMQGDGSEGDDARRLTAMVPDAWKDRWLP
jgi:tRNA threonylcarbamoyladenosine biosynthesis protein TsaE